MSDFNEDAKNIIHINGINNDSNNIKRNKSLLIVIIILILIFIVGISFFIIFAKNNNDNDNSSNNLTAMYSETLDKNKNTSESFYESKMQSEISQEILTETSAQEKNIKTEFEPITKVDDVDFPPSFPYIYATSELSSITNNDGTFYYSASNVFDGNYSTCWAEGSSGDGINESIFMTADKKQRVSEIIITNGLYTNSELFYKNNRVKDCLIEFSDGTSQNVTLLGNYSEQSNRIIFDPPVDTEYIKITILSVYYGNKYSDTCISEISVN